MILRDAWIKHLEPYGVSWPTDNQLLGLEFLYQRLGVGISQEELIAHYAKRKMQYNRQLRHVAAKGWHIASGNTRATRLPIDPDIGRESLKLVSVTAPNPIWLQQARLTRMGRAGVADWNEMLRAYTKHGCAVCGQPSKHYDKGHLDPSRPANLSNLVPMCAACNNWAGARNVVFELYGMIARPKMK